MKTRILLVGTLVLLATASGATAQILAPPINRSTEFENAFSGAVGIGSAYQRDAYFWEMALEYTRVIDLPWSVAAALIFDQEHDETGGLPRTVVNTFGLAATINWSGTDWLTLAAGLDKRFMDDDNPNQRLEFTDGDWGAGFAIGISLPDLPATERDATGLSLGWEWNITAGEPTVTAALGFGWSF